MAILKNQRNLFDIPDEVAYFNCAYNSPLLNKSRDRLRSGCDFKSHPWKRSADDFFQDAESIRVLAASIFGGDSSGYAIVPSASYGLSTAARAIEPHLKPGDKILIMEEEFPSNYLPWHSTSKISGAEIEIVKTPQHGDWTRAILEKINKSTRIVAISSCHWTNGAFIDLEIIGKHCREYGAIYSIDATQSLGAYPVSMDIIKPDFLVAAGYKWLLSPYGFSLLYVSDKWRNSRPLEESWLARENARDFASLVNYSHIYMPGSRKFDVGEKCTATILPGVIAGLEQINSWGVASIAESLKVINNQIAEMLENLQFKLLPPNLRSPHMFGAKLPSSFSGNLVSDLNKENIFISQRGNSLRFAPHLHVTEKDVNKLLDSIKSLVK